MIRRDPAYWQRLRKDVPSNLSVGLAAIAVLSATLSVIGTAVSGSQFDARANPLYWLLMVPMVWWVSGLTTFAPKYVNTIKPALALACIAGAVVADVSIADRVGFTLQLGACVITFLSSAGCLVVYRRSLIRREGPAR